MSDISLSQTGSSNISDTSSEEFGYVGVDEDGNFINYDDEEDEESHSQSEDEMQEQEVEE